MTISISTTTPTPSKKKVKGPADCMGMARQLARKRAISYGRVDLFEDAFSEALHAMAASVEDYQPERAAFTTYAYRVIWNALTKFFADEQAQPEQFPEDAPEPLERSHQGVSSERAEQADNLRELVMMLPPIERRIMTLRYFGWPRLLAREIAIQVNITPGQVKTRHKAALGMLKQMSRAAKNNNNRKAGGGNDY